MDVSFLAPYLISAERADDLARGSARELDIFIAPLVRHLERLFKVTGQPLPILTAAASLSGRLSDCSHHASAGMARLFGLEASARLAAGRGPEDAALAEARAHQAADIARRLTSPSIPAIGEYEMIAAVAMKAAGRLDESRQHLRKAATSLPSYELAVPLVRQEVLLLQDHRLFDRLLARATVYKSSRPREYYRTLKRAFEFNLNSGDVNASKDLLPELVRAFAACSQQMGTLDKVSYLKNLAHLLGAAGQRTRSLVVLRVTRDLAETVGLSGQARQIAALQADYASGSYGRLLTFELR